jgi:hypothetical protein
VVVSDEAHFIFADASFNNLTRVAYRELIQKLHPNTIMIFMSATLDEVENALIERLDEVDIGKRPTIHKYSTGTDYSYLNVKYFKDPSDIITTIHNDDSADKWLIFVTSIDEGMRLHQALGDDKASFIHSKTSQSPELEKLIQESKFSKKVLVATKVLDNGISIHDEQLRHIVVQAWDKTTFLQELGRKRVNINNAQKVNLYIPCKYKKSFVSKLECQYEPKQEQVDLWMNDRNGFCRKYDNNTNKVSQDLFYIDEWTREWELNPIGVQRLESDMKFAEYMETRFDAMGEFAFVTEQLGWIGLAHTFNEANLIENVTPNEVKEKLKEYLTDVEGHKLFADAQGELAQLVMSELVLKQLDYRTRKMKPSTLERILNDELGLAYKLEVKRECSKTSDHFRETYWKLIKT